MAFSDDKHKWPTAGINRQVNFAGVVCSAFPYRFILPLATPALY